MKADMKAGDSVKNAVCITGADPVKPLQAIAKQKQFFKEVRGPS